MIRKLMEKDREAVLTFLREEPLLNLFQIGDIRNYGFNSSIQTVYGYFDTNHQLTGVLLRYRQHYLPYFKEEGEVCQSFLDVIKTTGTGFKTTLPLNSTFSFILFHTFLKIVLTIIT